MVIDLDYHKNSTRLTLSTNVLDFTEETERPRVRKILKKLRKALGVPKGEALNVIVYTPADRWIVSASPPEDASPMAQRSELITPGNGHGMEVKLKGFPFGNEIPVGSRIVNKRADGSNVNPDNIKTHGDLALFVRGFAGGPRSALKNSNTVKDLINQLNANEYAPVSVAIHKVGFGLSSKIGAFLEWLETNPEAVVPAEVDPAKG